MSVTLVTPPCDAFNRCPTELLDQIISRVEYDVQSIHSTSYVSKSWRAVSLRYLFSTADFCSKTDFVRWNAIAESMPHVITYVRRVVFAPGTRKLERLIEDIGTRFPRDDNGERPEGYRAEFLRAMDEIRKMDLSPADIPAIPTMPSVYSFTWTGLPTHQNFAFHAPRFTPVTESFFRSFPAATDISFSCTPLVTDDARMVLSVFAKVQSITWTNGLIPPPPGDVHAPFLGQLSHLQVLSLTGHSRLPYLYWLGGALASSPLRRIELLHTTYLSGEEFARLLKDVSGTLEELVISSDMVISIQPTANLNLRALQTVTIEDIVFDGDASELQVEMDAIASMFTSLSTVPCPLLTMFSFRFEAQEEHESQDHIGDLFLNWKALANTISRRFPSLVTVRLWFMLVVQPTSDEREIMENLVKGRMPDLASKLAFIWAE